MNKIYIPREVKENPEFEKKYNALLSLDMEYAKKAMPYSQDPEVYLVAMHKIRYEVRWMPREVRHQSAAYLRENGYKDLSGNAILPEGQLPS